MGVGSHFNCCKGTLRNTVILFDDDDPKKKEEEQKDDVTKKDTNSNNNTNADYTFQAKSSINTKDSVIVGKNNNYINNEVFRPDNIQDKGPKDSQYSFNAWYQNLDK